MKDPKNDYHFSCVFAVSKQIALKIVIKDNFTLQNTFSNFDKEKLKTDRAKTRKMTQKNLQNCAISGSKTTKNDFSTLNKTFPAITPI